MNAPTFHAGHAGHPGHASVLAPQTHNLPAETELPGGVYLITVLCYACLLAAMWTTFSGHGYALFMVAISTFFGMVYFGLTGVLGRLERAERVRVAAHGAGKERNLRQFLRGEFETRTGTIAGSQALMQIVLIPFVVACASVVVGLIIASNR